MPWTNRGRVRTLEVFLRDQYNATTVPASFKWALATSATTPTDDTNLFSELTEIGAGNGYVAGGITWNRNTVDWDTLTEDDASDRAFIQAKNLTWAASGGPIPASGSGARYVCLVDPTSGELIFWEDLQTNRSAPDGQNFTVRDLELGMKKPA